MTDWSIVEVARFAGVTSRTLRHYDDIGLLTPIRVGAGGRRYYGRDELLRLQQIRLLRSFGVALPSIAAVVDGELPATLEQQLRRLREERTRLDRLIATVETTIDHLTRGKEMAIEDLFAGFENDPYEPEARDRYGDGAIDESRERIRTWSKADAELARNGYPALHSELAELFAAKFCVADPRVQDLVRRHYGLTCLFLTPDRNSYAALGRMYVADDRFRENIGGGNDAVVEYLSAAMGLFAEDLSVNGGTSDHCGSGRRSGQEIRVGRCTEWPFVARRRGHRARIARAERGRQDDGRPGANNVARCR